MNIDDVQNLGTTRAPSSPRHDDKSGSADFVSSCNRSSQMRMRKTNCKGRNRCMIAITSKVWFLNDSLFSHSCFSISIYIYIHEFLQTIASMQVDMNETM